MAACIDSVVEVPDRAAGPCSARNLTRQPAAGVLDEIVLVVRVVCGVAELDFHHLSPLPSEEGSEPELKCDANVGTECVAAPLS